MGLQVAIRVVHGKDHLDHGKAVVNQGLQEGFVGAVVLDDQNPELGIQMGPK